MENKNIWLDPSKKNITYYNENFAELLKELNSAISVLKTIVNLIDKFNYTVTDCDSETTDADDEFLDIVDDCDDFADNCDVIIKYLKDFRALLFSDSINWCEAQRQLENFFPTDKPIRERVRDLASEIPRQPIHKIKDNVTL